MQPVDALHADELAIDAELVSRLVAHALPDHAGLTVRPLASTGSSNALFRLGDGLVVRLPRQPGGTATIAKEQQWLPVVAASVTVTVPEVVAVGEPDVGYPERWAVTRWIDGVHPSVPWDATRPSSSHALAQQLSRFIGELRSMPVPPEAVGDPALSWYRGRPLADVDGDLRAAVAWCRDAADLGLDLDLDRALGIWEAALDAEHSVDAASTWFHGDLLAENILLDRRGGLTGVLDFGGLAVGDPTVDLVVGWEVLDEQGREVLRRELAVDDATWSKARGWALLIALNTFPYYWRTMPGRCAARRELAAAVLASD